MTPDVSIIIPCHNRASLVGEAIESALAQDCAREVIVIDDGSTDESWQRITDFGKALRAVRTDNRGVSAARNRGIAEARGRFIHFCDSDDRIVPGAVSALLAATSTRRPREIVFGDGITIDLAGSPLPGPTYGFSDAPVGEPMPIEQLLSGTMPCWLALYPAEALREANGFDDEIAVGEDQELALRLAIGGYHFVRVSVAVLEVRQHQGDRLSSGRDSAFHTKVLTLYRRLMGLIEREGLIGTEEAAALADRVWAGGRAAARDGCQAEANALFLLAGQLAPHAASNPLLRALYPLLGPYWTERLLEVVKGMWHGSPTERQR